MVHLIYKYKYFSHYSLIKLPKVGGSIFKSWVNWHTNQWSYMFRLPS